VAPTLNFPVKKLTSLKFSVCSYDHDQFTQIAQFISKNLRFTKLTLQGGQNSRKFFSYLEPMLDFKDTIFSIDFDFLSFEDEKVSLSNFTNLQELKCPDNAIDSIAIKSL
jgi:hypothetical protein